VGSISSAGIAPEAFDLCFPLSPLSNPEYLSKIGYKYMMVLPEHPDAYHRRNPLVKIFSDSGGFQLSRGIVDFIDPDKLVQNYHAHIDYGIGLDIPLSLHLQDTPWLMRMARVTALNDKYIASHLKKLNSKAAIYDVSHGLTLQNRLKFTEHIVKNKAGVGLALGGIGQAKYDDSFTNLLMAVINLSAVLSQTKGEYDKYHVLGTTNPFMLSIYTILTEVGAAPFISSDSSTYAQAAISHRCLGVRHGPNLKVSNFEIPAVKHNIAMPCNCPICFLTGSPLGYKLTAMGNAVHGMHNIYQLYQLSTEMTLAYMKGHIKQKELLDFTCNSPNLKDMARAIYAFVLDMDKGFDVAWKKHQSTLNDFLRRSFAPSGLFGGTSSVREEHVAASKVTTKAIERYEAFHGIKHK
jgi:hypothetical protein